MPVFQRHARQHRCGVDGGLNGGNDHTSGALDLVSRPSRRSLTARYRLTVLRLNPSYADAYALLGGINTYTGQPAESVSLLRAALRRLNPGAGSLFFLLLGRALYFLGEYEQARVNLAAVLGQLGDREGVAWQATEIRAVEPNFSANRWLATYPMTDERQKERLAQAPLPFGL